MHLTIKKQIGWNEMHESQTTFLKKTVQTQAGPVGNH